MVGNQILDRGYDCSRIIKSHVLDTEIFDNINGNLLSNKVNRHGIIFSSDLDNPVSLSGFPSRQYDLQSHINSISLCPLVAQLGIWYQLRGLTPGWQPVVTFCQIILETNTVASLIEKAMMTMTACLSYYPAKQVFIVTLPSTEASSCSRFHLPTTLLGFLMLAISYCNGSI